MGVRLLGLNSSRFLSAFKVREINAVVFFRNKFLYTLFENVWVIIRFMHGSNMFCMNSMLESYILFTIEKCKDIIFYKFE